MFRVNLRLGSRDILLKENQDWSSILDKETPSSKGWKDSTEKNGPSATSQPKREMIDGKFHHSVTRERELSFKEQGARKFLAILMMVVFTNMALISGAACKLLIEKSGKPRFKVLSPLTGGAILMLLTALFSKTLWALLTQKKEKVIFNFTNNDNDQKKLLNEFPPQMIEALGGMSEFLKLSKAIKTISNEGNKLKERIKEASDPNKTVSTVNDENSFYFVFRYFMKGKQSATGVQYVEILKWDPNEARWVFEPNNALFLKNSIGQIVSKANEEKFMIDRIRRFVKGEAIGELKPYGPSLIQDSEALKKNPPQDAYLKGKELEEYIDTPTLFYEVDPSKAENVLVKELSKKG